MNRQIIVCPIRPIKAKRRREVVDRSRKMIITPIRHIIIIIAANQLLFFGLISWSDTFWPHVRIFTVLLSEVSRLLLAFLIITHGQVLITLVGLAFEFVGVHHIHVFLEETLDCALRGFIIGHDRVTVAGKTAACLGNVVFLLLFVVSAARLATICSMGGGSSRRARIDCRIASIIITADVDLLAWVSNWLSADFLIVLLSFCLYHAHPTLLANIVDSRAHHIVNPELGQRYLISAKSALLGVSILDHFWYVDHLVFGHFLLLFS